MNTQGIEMSPNHTTSTWAAGADPYAPGHGPRGGKNRLAGAAMVLGIVGLSTSIVFIGGLLGVVGLVLGLIALQTTKRTGAGRGMSITGVVTSSIAIVVSVLVAVFFVWYANKTQECYQPDSFQQYKQCVHQQLTGN
ncbi:MULTISPECIES: DUF4190 domain-containing protein [unclassified Streptomyces]|uniref:DUF4190 domain-containing protein n=1 Tax=Streptomyces sp. NPDC127532 TaxID=3345399 RepID=UPI00363D65C3